MAKANRPLLEIDSGNGWDFNKRVANTDPAVEEHRVLAAVAKFLRVSETRGRSGARNVVVRPKDLMPPAPHSTALVELRWANYQETNDIQPSGHKDLFAELLIFYETRDGEKGWRTTPTVLDHTQEVEFTLEILVEGKSYSETRFHMDNAWCSERMEALPYDDWPPEALEFPTIDPV